MQARQQARRKRKELGQEPPRGYVLSDAFRLWCNLKRGRITSYMDEKRRLERYIRSARISRDKLGKMTIKPLISMDPFMSKAFKDPQNLVALTTDDDKLVFSLLAARLSSAHLVEYNRRR